jgi:hypothetical protein
VLVDEAPNARSGVRRRGKVGQLRG